MLLARALFSDPELLILDEPASGLDLPSRELLLEALGSAAATSSSRTTLVATHHLEEVAPSTTHAALLRGGQLVTSGPVHRVLTAEMLEACFGIPVEVGRRGRGWWAAAVDRASPGPRGPRR